MLLRLLQVLVLLLLEEHRWYLGLQDPGKEEVNEAQRQTDRKTDTYPWLLLPMTQPPQR